MQQVQMACLSQLVPGLILLDIQIIPPLQNTRRRSNLAPIKRENKHRSINIAHASAHQPKSTKEQYNKAVFRFIKPTQVVSFNFHFPRLNNELTTH
jgi:hypothetical protein